jgi:hypothetical protein
MLPWLHETSAQDKVSVMGEGPPAAGPRNTLSGVITLNGQVSKIIGFGSPEAMAGNS